MQYFANCVIVFPLHIIVAVCSKLASLLTTMCRPLSLYILLIKSLRKAGFIWAFVCSARVKTAKDLVKPLTHKDMATKLYKVSYIGIDHEGNELFNFCRYYSDSKKAKARIHELSEKEYAETLNSYLYPNRIDLYTHLNVYEEQEGEYKNLRHFIMAYSIGNEESREREERINTDCELYKLL